MPWTRSSACVALLCAALVTPPAERAHETPRGHVVDLIPSFLDFWARAGKLPGTDQARLFRQIVVTPHPEVFTSEVFRIGSPFDHQLDALVTRFLADPPDSAVVRALHDRLRHDLKDYHQRFLRLLPEDRDLTVYLVPSLDAFSGAQRPIAGRLAVLVGVDNLARSFKPTDDLGPVVQHEMFHWYHWRLTNPWTTLARNGGLPMYWWMWDEGMACYVAHQLNAETPEALVLGFTAAQLDSERHALPSLLAIMHADFDSTDWSTYGQLFGGRRGGYYVGWLVARQLARTHTVTELAHLSGPTLRQQLEEALTGLGVAGRVSGGGSRQR